MDQQLQAELRAMRDEQRALRQRLGALDERITQFEMRAADAMVAEEINQPKPEILTAVPPSVPPPLPPLPVPVAAKEPAAPAVSLETIAADAGWRSAKPPTLPAETIPAKTVPLPPPVPQTMPATVPAPKRESLEVQIGTVWLVRGGVVLILTALVFAGVWLYENVVPHLGAGGKVALLYLGAGGLTGLGAWLERSRQARDNPRLGNYAQVIFAGGLAAVYYVTYAAHYIERLRVIDSALVAGAMLLAWTAFMVGLAHRRSSETLATVAILLAFYASAINEGVAAFTLVSNLILAGGTVFLLRRHLWRVFPFVGVMATFGSYGFWTYHASLLSWERLGAPPVHAQHGPGGFWIESAFLFVYWALFTWAAFTAGEGVLASYRRAGFVSLNNSAFFLLTTWLVLGQGPGWFWKWSLGFGVVLLALAEACRRLPRPADAKTEDTYLLQGVLLVTTGFVAYFEGWQLSIVLAVQAVVLLAAAGRRANVWLLGCSLATAVLSFGWAVQAFGINPHQGGWLTPLAVGGLLVGAAWLAQRLTEKSGPEPAGAGWFEKALAPAPSLYSLLGCVVWFALIAQKSSTTEGGVLAFVGGAVALTASIYVLRVKALTIYAQAFLTAGVLIWASETLIRYTPGSSGPNAWLFFGPLVGALVLGHWWQLLPGRAGWTPGKTSRFFNALDAVLAVAVVLVWFLGSFRSEQTQGSDFMAAGSAGLALVVFAYAVATRYRALAVASQGLLLVGILFFFNLCSSPWLGSAPEVVLALVPLIVLLTTLATMRFLVPPDRWTRSLEVGAVFYEVIATVIFLVWAVHYLPDETLAPVFLLAGAAVFALGVERHVRRWLFLSCVPTLAGVCAYLGGAHEVRGSWLAVAGILLLVGQQQFGRRRLGVRLAAWFPTGWQNSLMIAAALCGWVFVSEQTGRWHGSAFSLALGWSLFAAVVFAMGIALGERIYRWAGLAVMGATFGHLFLFDIMQLGSAGKAVGFLALGTVLLATGFLYIKFQDKFRDLL